MAWLDRLQSSIREAGNHKGPRAFHELRTIDQEDESEPDSEGRRTQAQAAESTVKDNQSVAADDVAQDDDKLQSTLPESHVPLGLIADLSISNSKSSRRKAHAKEAQINEEDLNDDNVVRPNIICDHLRTLDLFYFPGGGK